MTGVVLAIVLVQGVGVDRTKPPTLPPPPALKLPAVRTATLPNGLQLAVVENHKVPVVDVSLVLDAGAVRVPGLNDVLGAGPRSTSPMRRPSSAPSSRPPRGTTSRP